MKDTNFEIEQTENILEELTQSQKYIKDKKAFTRNKDKIIVNYDNQYIGVIADNLLTREEFGINVYRRDLNFEWYYGQWKNNLKEGIGFIRLGEDQFYFGKWKDGQFEEKGIYIWLTNSNLDDINKDTILTDIEYQVFIGNFKNNEKEKGCYLMNEKRSDTTMNTIVYLGKIENNKKHDSNCILIELNNQRVFKGKIENDEMIDGIYLSYNTNDSLSSDIMFNFSKKDDKRHSFVIEKKIQNPDIKQDILNKVKDFSTLNKDIGLIISEIMEITLLKYSQLTSLRYYNDFDVVLKELTDLYNKINLSTIMFY